MGNPTPISLIEPFQSSGKVAILRGVWLREEDTRNECFAKACQEQMDWLLTVDADEFYTDQGWDAARRALLRSENEENVATKWYNFFRSSQFVLVNKQGGLDEENASFALRCKPQFGFANRRQPNSRKRMLLDVACYHYGYVMSDEEMLTKLTTWSHTNDFDPMRWYRLKWLDWNESVRNLHPVRPVSWPCAVRFPLEQPGFAAPFELQHIERSRSYRTRLENAWYDACADSLERLRQIRHRLPKAFTVS